MNAHGDDTIADRAADPARNTCGCGRSLSPGWYACHSCGRKFLEDLDEIADRHRRLSATPSLQPGRYDRAGRSAPGSRPPGSLNVAALRDLRSGQTEPTTWRGADGKHHRESEHDTPAVLRAVLGWCETIASERGFTTEPWLPQPRPAPPPDPTLFTMADHDEMTGAVDFVDERRAELAARNEAAKRRRERWDPRHVVDTATAWLARQDDWVARWPAASELHRNARLLRNRLRAACGEPNLPPIGRCIRFVSSPDGEVECGAPIFEPPPARGRTPAVFCSSRHRHAYDGVDVMRLILINEQQEAS